MPHPVALKRIFYESYSEAKRLCKPGKLEPSHSRPIHGSQTFSYCQVPFATYLHTGERTALCIRLKRISFPPSQAPATSRPSLPGPHPRSPLPCLSPSLSAPTHRFRQSPPSPCPPPLSLPLREHDRHSDMKTAVSVRWSSCLLSASRCLHSWTMHRAEEAESRSLPARRRTRVTWQTPVVMLPWTTRRRPWLSHGHGTVPGRQMASESPSNRSIIQSRHGEKVSDSGL